MSLKKSPRYWGRYVGAADTWLVEVRFYAAISDSHDALEILGCFAAESQTGFPAGPQLLRRCPARRRESGPTGIPGWQGPLGRSDAAPVPEGAAVNRFVSAAIEI